MLWPFPHPSGLRECLSSVITQVYCAVLVSALEEIWNRLAANVESVVFVIRMYKRAFRKPQLKKHLSIHPSKAMHYEDYKDAIHEGSFQTQQHFEHHCILPLLFLKQSEVSMETS